MPSLRKSSNTSSARHPGHDSELEYLTLMHDDTPTRPGWRVTDTPAGPGGGRATLVFGALVVGVVCVMALGMWFAVGTDQPTVPAAAPGNAQQAASSSTPAPG